MRRFDDAGPAFGSTPQGSPPFAVPSEESPSVTALREVALDASTTLVSAESDEFDTKLRWGLGSVGEELDVDRAAVLQTHGEGFERTRGPPVPRRLRPSSSTRPRASARGRAGSRVC